MLFLVWCVPWSSEESAEWSADATWKYNYIWNTAQNASTYTSLTFGAFFTELSQNFKCIPSGQETHKVRFHFWHDGLMIGLASGLGFAKREETWETSR
ncbi:hypothetical protein HYDPIDRAFT_118356 [Hydnomerulius pinastri MD-312]|uniref:Uncharacterized protein n=1 Tax=Hydnomerulius pinastri MD-312 TaxID=994086 RepID=A0A0C9W150_9AGAM|nr:hypothetical protein HYDPIDRAFT_118356 [Hydnomerulius pinastri MD-312]